MTKLQETNKENLKNQWSRTTFDFYDGKAYCYRKRVKHEKYDREIKKGFYCYNCKDELFFKWKDEDEYYENSPFRFHQLLVKVLEKKSDDWKIERKTHSYYAFCCKCVNQEETLKKKFGKIMDFKMEPCDCASFIEDKKQEATQAIINYDEMIKDCNWIETQLKNIKELKHKNSENMKRIGKGSFIERRLDDFINQLESRRSDAITSKRKEENYLLLYGEWEIKLNQQNPKKSNVIPNPEL